MRAPVSYMDEFFRIAHHLLSKKAVSLLIIVSAIASRVIQLIFFYNIRVDASYQVLATENFVNGHGITIGSVNPHNLSEIIYRPLTNWPPGYTLLLSPFYLLLNRNYIAAGLALDIVMAVALIIICRQILRLLSVPLYLVNLCTIVNGFFIYYFYFIASSDGVAIPVFLFAIFSALKLLRKQGEPLLNALLMLLFLLLAGLLKYLFMPVVFVLPLYLAAMGFINNDKTLKRTGIGSFFLLLIFTVGFLFHQISISGNAAHISSPGRGIFPQHLLDTYPFVTASFMKPDTIEGLMPGNTTALYASWQILNLLLVIFLLYSFIYFIAKRGLRHLSIAAHFFHLSFFLSAIVFHVLAILSLQVQKEEILSGWFWTYLEEARYYGLVTVLIHISLFVLYNIGLRKLSFLTKLIFVILTIFLFAEILRGVFFTFNRVRWHGKEEYRWQSEDRFQKYVDTLVTKAEMMYPGTKIIVSGSSYYFNHRVGLYSHIPILYDPRKVFDAASAQTTKPVVVVNILSKKSSSPQQSVYMRNEKVEGNFGEFVFYITYVAPR